MSWSGLRWHVYPNGETLAAAVTQSIAAEAERAISAAGRFLIVLSGGETPQPIYAKLSKLELSWSQWHVYFGDERCFPAGHPERNDVMARGVWLDHVPIPENQIHCIPAEAGPQRGAKLYGRTLAGVQSFDLALLGLGEDGHTASLFPGHPIGDEPGAPDVLAVHGAPKEPASRVTLSAGRLSRSIRVQLIVMGAEKREAVGRLSTDGDLPICHVNPPTGIEMCIDESALTTESARSSAHV